jgi:hypothetical protein
MGNLTCSRFFWKNDKLIKRAYFCHAGDTSLPWQPYTFYIIAEVNNNGDKYEKLSSPENKKMLK